MKTSRLKFKDIITPAVAVELDVVRRNIDRLQAYANTHGLKLRPHIKTHKLPQIAELQLAAGAVGINCQKVSEAEAMAAASSEIRNILITYNVLGREKLERLVALARRLSVSVVADNAIVVKGLSDAFAGEAAPLAVFVECNTGADRCGVGTPEEATRLAREIAEAPGLVFAGLMTYPPVDGATAVQHFMTEAKRQIERAGMAVPVITSGGTPSMMSAADAPVVTEYRAGTYVYNDRSLVARGACTWDDCALTVLATVVSVPSPHRAIIDAGSKILTSDLLGLEGYGHVHGHPEIAIDQLSEEHGRLVSKSPIGLAVGDLVRIVPNHACVVSNMVDAVEAFDGDRHVGRWRVVARGCVV